MSEIVVTAAYPFVPADIEIYHLASTYIPADVQTRFLRALGHDVAFVSGTDVHGVQARRYLDTRDADAEAALRACHRGYADRFDSVGVDLDTYEMLFGGAFEEAVHRAYRACDNRGLISADETAVYRCTACGYYLPNRFRRRPDAADEVESFDAATPAADQLVCGFCDEQQVVRESSRHSFLDLPGSDAYEPVLRQQLRSDVSARLRSEADAVERWDITRDDYFGVPHPDREGLSFYLWFGSLAGLPTLLDDDTVDRLRSPRAVTFQHFMGKNLTYYHGVVLPVIADAGLGFRNTTFQLSPRGFMSDSDGGLSLSDVPPAHAEYLRYYVMTRLTDTMNDFVLRPSEFTRVTNNVVCDKLGGFFSRACTILAEQGVDTAPDPPESLRGLGEFIDRTETLVSEARTTAAVDTVQSYFDHAHGLISEGELYDDPGAADRRVLTAAVANGLALLAPVMPGRVATYNVFESWSPDRIPARVPPGTPLDHDTGRWEKID
jgi:methionyl-tRNA synthetase